MQISLWIRCGLKKKCLHNSGVSNHLQQSARSVLLSRCLVVDIEYHSVVRSFPFSLFSGADTMIPARISPRFLSRTASLNNGKPEPVYRINYTPEPVYPLGSIPVRTARTAPETHGELSRAGSKPKRKPVLSAIASFADIREAIQAGERLEPSDTIPIIRMNNGKRYSVSDIRNMIRLEKAARQAEKKPSRTAPAPDVNPVPKADRLFVRANVSKRTGTLTYATIRTGSKGTIRDDTFPVPSEIVSYVKKQLFRGYYLGSKGKPVFLRYGRSSRAGVSKGKAGAGNRLGSAHYVVSSMPNDRNMAERMQQLPDIIGNMITGWTTGTGTKLRTVPGLFESGLSDVLAGNGSFVPSFWRALAKRAINRTFFFAKHAGNMPSRVYPNNETFRTGVRLLGTMMNVPGTDTESVLNRTRYRIGRLALFGYNATEIAAMLTNDGIPFGKKGIEMVLHHLKRTIGSRHAEPFARLDNDSRAELLKRREQAGGTFNPRFFRYE